MLAVPLMLALVTAAPIARAAGHAHATPFAQPRKAETAIERFLRRSQELTLRFGRKIVEASEVTTLEGRLQQTVEDLGFRRALVDVLIDAPYLDVADLLRATDIDVFVAAATRALGRDAAGTLRQAAESTMEFMRSVGALPVKDVIAAATPPALEAMLADPAVKPGVELEAVMCGVTYAVQHANLVDGETARWLARRWLQAARAILVEVDPVQSALRRAEDDLPAELRKWIVRLTYRHDNEPDGTPCLIVDVVLRDNAPDGVRSVSGNTLVTTPIRGRLFAFRQPVYVRLRLASEPA